MKSFKHTFILAVAAICIIPAAQSQIISVSFDNNPTPSGMSTTDLAGAPGMRVGYWNNWAKDDTVMGDDGQTVVDESGAAVSGFTATEATGFAWTSRDNLHDNDQEMFSDVIDVQSSESIQVDGIPYEMYNVYVYMRDDGSARAGSFQIGSTTYYARGGAGNPASDGSGYVLSVDPSYGSGADIQQGNYVVLSNQTGSSLTLTCNAVNAGDSVTRNKVAGFQIENAPPPPNQPNGLTAVGGNGQVNLSWNSVSNAISYNVKRSLVSGGPYAVLAAVTDTGFEDTAVTNGIDYFYVISSNTGSGESVDSSEAFAMSTHFVHPGCLFKLSDLERMRLLVESGSDPWYTSFLELQAEAQASYNYVVRGNSYTTVSRDSPYTNKSAYESDVTAAYYNALMWAITQDTRHADKCVEIFNEWKTLTNVQGAGTESLNGGIYAWKLVEAAEIIKSTYDGWSYSDLQEFKDMLVYPGYSDTAVPSSVNNTNGTFYWRIYKGDSGRHGNQDAIGWRAMLSMGVFLDNEKMYDRALRYFKSLPGRADDIPMPTGPSPSGSLRESNQYFNYYNYVGSTGSIPDYGYNGALTNYFWETGQCQESSRDQSHTFFGMGICAGIAEVAWNQGDAVWNAFDERLLKAFEYNSKYNTSFIASYPDQPTPWEPTGTNFIQRTDRSGRWFSKKINPYHDSDFARISRGTFPGNRPIYEQAVAHFGVRMGKNENDYLWTLRSRDVAINESGYETRGVSLDHAGWGAICFRRPVLTAGDPISGYVGSTPQFELHKLSGVIEAENYDWFADDGDGHTYHDLTPTNNGGAYRADAVDISALPDGGYAITDLEAGEWLTYTVYVPATAEYGINAVVASTNAGGTLRISLGGTDMTADVPVMDTGSMTNWVDVTLAKRVLPVGVHALRVHIGGTSNAFNLDRISVLPVLQATYAGSNMDFSWPINHPGWMLETTGSLTNSTWNAIPGSDAGNSWSEPVSAGNAFYRLIAP